MPMDASPYQAQGPTDPGAQQPGAGPPSMQNPPPPGMGPNQQPGQDPRMMPFGQQPPANFLQQIRMFSADCAQIEELVTELQKMVLQIKPAMPPDRAEMATQAMGQLLAAQNGLTGARMALEMSTQPQQQESVAVTAGDRPTGFAGLVEQVLEAETPRELVREHERLVKVLKSPSHADDRREAEIQGRELARYRRQVRGTTEAFQKTACSVANGTPGFLEQSEALATTPHFMSGGGGTSTATIETPEREYRIHEFADGPVTRYAVSRIGDDLRSQVPIYVFHNPKAGTWRSTLFKEDEDEHDRYAELVKRWVFQGKPARIADADRFGGSPEAYPFMSPDGYERMPRGGSERGVGYPDPGPGQGAFYEARMSKNDVLAAARQTIADIRSGKLKTRGHSEPHQIMNPDGTPHRGRRMLVKGQVGHASQPRRKS